jgi:arabinoxylan arabinofuranohydrolase
VNEAKVNEETQKISQVTTNLTGVTQIKNMTPYEWQEAETMASCGGVDYEDYVNIKKNGRVSSLGNDASINMLVKMKAGSWINVRGVNYGTTGASQFTLRAKGTGKMELRNGTGNRTTVATIEFSSTEMEEQTFDIPEGKLKGEKTNLYFVVTDATDFYVDAWQFTEMGTDGIQTMEDSKPVKRQSFDLSGRRLSNSKQAHGVIIEQTIDANGVKHQRKHLSGK